MPYTLTTTEKELLIALAWMYSQYAGNQPDFINASEDAQELLRKYGLMSADSYEVDELKLDELERE